MHGRSIKRLLLALGLTVMAAPGHAQESGDRVATRRHHSAHPSSASPAENALHWFANHAATPAGASAATPEHPRSHASEAEAAAATSEPSPVTVAIHAIVPTPVEEPRHTSGYHSCDSGERIISAFYWEGSHTASGEHFNPDGMTAAHRTFPFGTQLTVTNPRTGRSVVVRINDRGPFVKGVSLDLSRGAARAIGLQGTGAVCMARM